MSAAERGDILYLEVLREGDSGGGGCRSPAAMSGVIMAPRMEASRFAGGKACQHH